MRFTKDESEINLATGEADAEFAEWKWASPEEVIEQVQQNIILLVNQVHHYVYETYLYM